MELLSKANIPPFDETLAETALTNIPFAIEGNKSNHRSFGSNEDVINNIVQLLKRHMSTESICKKALLAIKTLQKV